MIERLLLSTHIFSNKMATIFSIIQIQRPWQSVSDWAKWEEAIQSKIASLNKREVFTLVMTTPSSIFPMGYKWVFVPKRNENNEVVIYKARLVAQGFTQRPGIDFNETYSPVMSGITFRYLISLVVQKHLSM